MKNEARDDKRYMLREWDLFQDDESFEWFDSKSEAIKQAKATQYEFSEVYDADRQIEIYESSEEALKKMLKESKL